MAASASHWIRCPGFLLTICTAACMFGPLDARGDFRLSPDQLQNEKRLIKRSTLAHPGSTGDDPLDRETHAAGLHTRRKANVSTAGDDSSTDPGTTSRPPGGGDARQKYTLGFLYTLLEGRSVPRLAYYLGAIRYAVKHLNAHILQNAPFRLEFRAKDTFGDVKASLEIMTRWRNSTIAFIGPDDECYVQSYLAAAWNKPIISYNCQDSRISDESIFNTFARTIPSTSKISQYMLAVLKYYKWKMVTLIQQDSTKWREAAEALENSCEQQDILIRSKEFFPENFVPGNKTGNVMDRIIRETFEQTRIYIFLGDYDALTDFVRKMFTKRLITAEYVVLSLRDRTLPDLTHSTNYFTHFTEGEPHVHMVQAFQVVLLLEPRHRGRGSFVSFIDKAGDYSILPPFEVKSPPSNYSINYSLMPTAMLAAYLYDAVYIIADAINQTLAEGGDVTNGTDVMRRTRQRTYRSCLGNEMYIDKHGESQHLYNLLALKTDPTVRNNKRMMAVGSFSPPGLDQNDLDGLVFQPDPSYPIEWLDGSVPLTEPKCGFDGRKCHWPIAISCIVAASVILIVFVFGCRHYIYEQKLARLLWKIETEDLLFADSENQRALSDKLKGKKYGRSSFNLTSGKINSVDGVHQGARASFNIATYRGSLVAVKTYYKRSLEISRAVKLELHHMKEMAHDNINRFIGATLDPPYVYIVTQYCTRRSLKDILQNDDLPLDEMFTASLVSDMVKGMIYLHDSESISHGNLTSSNCLVDCRWVLQIADFGFHFLRAFDYPENDRQHEKMLYRAPELLRMRCPPPQGTQKSDVYSFGMVLHEIHCRTGPWGDCPYSPKEILERVRAVPMLSDEPLRPDITGMQCGDCVIRCLGECWDEEPDLRPDFKYIRFRLKPMQRGLRSNIFDNMLAIMEKYATTLEAIVEERTTQLLEEKKKTEALLLRMLPKSVADQLKRGEHVEPEQYSCVTIYFSDIVGFTALSAESTPLQVVTLLNDLYTLFDSIIGEYDVYKVETIGDAYMVVSGLPIRCGDTHAGEIASMSLHLLNAIKDFRIRHKPNELLMLRIGIHSGACVAGVVGLKMPRYCLFGDTVNTASRLESTGVPLKIHCSSETKSILDSLGGYNLEERGYVLLKGKGEVFTYFLTGEDVTQREKRISLLRRERTITDFLRSQPKARHACESLHATSYLTRSATPANPASSHSSALSLFDIDNDP